MKIALLSGASSIHTARWANGLQAAGHEVHVISQHPRTEKFTPDVQVHLSPFRGTAGYFMMVPTVRRLLKQLRPDIVNAHYASGYATTARLVRYRPWVLSVWGSDVYDFPYKSPLHYWLIHTNVLSADAVASTSQCMAEQVRHLAPTVGNIAITPFGVDLSAFQGSNPTSQARPGRWVIGTVKTMAERYGIDTLIEAFALLLHKLTNTNTQLANQLHLLLVGGGPQTAALQQLVQDLGIADRVEFIGQVPHAQIPQTLAGLDIYVALSRSESFGVAILEAGAAGRPVVVSDAGGLPEVTMHGVTGIVVPREHPQAAADAMEQLLLNAELRQQMGRSAQLHVAKHYSWPACIHMMEEFYGQTVAAHRTRYTPYGRGGAMR